MTRTALPPAFRLLVMAKAPVPGAAKTRLRLPPEEAAALQAALTRDAAAKASALGPTTVAGTPPNRLDLLRPLLPENVRLVPQLCGGDLGEKMLAAARRLFREGPEPVVILGTDAPTLPPASIEGAARSLAGATPHDASIVGSEDGGYVLLGLGAAHAALFRDVDWSTDAVYRQTLEKARELGLEVHEGETHYDVDTPEDLERLRRELREDPGLAQLAPHTAGALGLL